MINLQILLTQYASHDIQKLKDNWDVKWCTFDEFYRFAIHMWNLNVEFLELNTKIGFISFLRVEYRIIKEAPSGMKELILGYKNGEFGT